MKCRLKDLTFGRNGEQLITLAVPEDDFRGEFDKLKDSDVEVSIKKYRKRRSLDANAYCWVLCGKLAEELSNEKVLYSKDDIYRRAIKEIGVYRDFNNLSPEEAKTLQTAWSMLGTGWISEQVDFSQDGESVILRCYYGSSQYNTKQMSMLIESLVQDCQALGIETKTPAQIEEMMSLWANAPKGE